MDRKRNLWVLLPRGKIKNLGLAGQPPAEALYWALEGDQEWHPMPSGWAGRGDPVRAPGTTPKAAPPTQRTLGFMAGSAGSPDLAGDREGEPAQPILRWPGGKRYLLPQLARLLDGFPLHTYDYLEPMFGGGACFWRFGGRFRTRTIGDLQADLVTLYRVLRSDVEGLITELQSGGYEYRGKHDPQSLARFKQLLALEPISPVARAARYLFLNRACWGGMLRVHRGRLKASPNLGPARICDPGRLRACAHALQGVQILRGSACQVIGRARAAHPDRRFLVFVDPPYDDPQKRFREYAGEFTRRDQAQLVSVLLESRYKFVYTNKATDYILALFARARGVEQITLPLRHKLGSKGPPETELLVHNLAC